MDKVEFIISNSRKSLFYLYEIMISLNIECQVRWNLTYHTRASIYSITHLHVKDENAVKMLAEINSMKMDEDAITGFIYFADDSPLTEDEKASIFGSIRQALDDNVEKLTADYNYDYEQVRKKNP